MQNPVEQLLALKRKLESARTLAARREGELSQVLQRLKEDGIDNLTVGEILQKRREERIAELEAELAAGVVELQKQWNKELEA